MATLEWRLAIQVFMPTWDGFVLGVSKLGGTDTIGLPDLKSGRWVDVTCNGISVDIRQGFVQANPLSTYDTGTATITLDGLDYAPSANPDFLPGVEMRVMAYAPATKGIYTDLYDNQFLIGDGGDLALPIFYGYVIDVLEDRGKTANNEPQTVTIECVDEYYKVVKAIGDDSFDIDVLDVAQWMADQNIRISSSLTSTPITVFRGGDDTLKSIERAVHSCHGALYVRGNTLYFADRDVWDYGTPVVSITDVHSGSHLCYYDFGQSMKLTNIVNDLAQTNTYWVANGADKNDATTTTTWENVSSKGLYNPSGQTVETSTPNWDGSEYLIAGSYPQLRTQTVDVQLTKNNLDLIPAVMDTVTFTNSGTTETRIVSQKHVVLTPEKWSCELTFFDWVLGDSSLPAAPQQSARLSTPKNYVYHTPIEFTHTELEPV